MRLLIAVLALVALAGCGKRIDPVKVATAPYPPSDYKQVAIPMRGTVLVSSEGVAELFHERPDTNWWAALVPKFVDDVQQANGYGVNDSMVVKFPVNGRRFMVYSTTTLRVRELKEARP